MKRIISTFVLIICLTASLAAQNITFKFSDGLYKENLKMKVERNISSLLTEITQASDSDRHLNLSSLDMAKEAQENLDNLWEMFHFRCDFEENVERCLMDVNGYEVRGIPITLTNTDNTFTGDKERELAICFDSNGQIDKVHMALSTNMFSQVMGNGKEVTDSRRRLEILKFVEDFRSYYDEKNLEALRQIYSEDALIITGKVVMRKTTGEHAQLLPEIVYNKYNKEQYLEHLAKIFRTKKYIKVKFDDIKVVRHGAPNKANFYGVTLHQNWQTNNYQDDGYVFLLWEFPEDGSHPLVHVRTWQPEMVGNQRLSKDEVFNINDFFIP